MSLPSPVKAALRYARRVLQGADHMLNTLTGGQPDETVSFRAAVNSLDANPWVRRPACVLCRVLGWFQRDHCALILDSTRRSANLLSDLIARVAPPKSPES